MASLANRRIIIAIQARLASARLPGKILLPFCGVPMLAYQVQRLATYTQYPVVALVPAADYLQVLAAAAPYVTFPAWITPSAVPENDVLGRYAEYARACELGPDDLLIRVTGDCPLLCPWLLHEVVETFRRAPHTYAYYGMGPGWPDGLADIDVMTVGALLDADKKATDPVDREHTTPYLWNRPQVYHQGLYALPAMLKGRRWPKFSVDTQGDLAYVEAIAQTLGRRGPTFTWRDVLYQVTQHPDLAEWQHYEPMNAGYLTQLGSEASWEEVRYGREKT